MFDDEDATFRVVVNHEEQHSIWPEALGDPPDGWRTVGVEGPKADCLAWIDEHWTDLRPASLRRALAEDRAPEPASIPSAPAATLVDRLLAGGPHPVQLVGDGAELSAAGNRAVRLRLPATRGGTVLGGRVEEARRVGDEQRLVVRTHLDGATLLVTADLHPTTLDGRATIVRGDP
jgi:MbtH protein